MTAASALVAIALTAATPRAQPPSSRPVELPSRTFGEVALAWPDGVPGSAVLLLAGSAAREDTARLARAFASDGALVLVVDVEPYLHRARRRCAYAAGDLEVLSQSIQKSLALSAYLKPVVVGTSSGATLAYAALAQAPLGTFAGGISVGFCSAVAMEGTLCPGETLSRRHAGARELLAPSPVRAPWKVWAGTRDRTCTLDAARSFAAGVSGAEVVSVDGAVEGAAAEAPWLAGVRHEVLSLARAARPPDAPVARATADDDAASVAGLPLVEAPAESHGALLAIVLTGDGGWASIDRALAAQLTDAGIGVVGLDSLRYFWSRKTPEQLGRDLGRIAEHYRRAWHRDEVVLVGYSRGADAIPLAWKHLPQAVVHRIRLVALLGAGLNAELEIHVADLFSGGPPGDPVLPAVSGIGAPLLCVYGSEEADETVCTAIAGRPRVHSVALGGGHHFGGDYDGVARLILQELQPLR